MPEGQRCAIYARISTEEQALDHQIELLKDFANEKGWTVTKVYSDVTSGKNDKRKGFDELFDDARKQLFDIVLFYDLSRFSRSGLLFTLQRLKELERRDIAFHSYNDPFISTMDPMLKDLVIAMMATFAKIERQMISERTKAALAAKKAQGVQLGRSRFPKEAEEKTRALLLRWADPDDDEITSYKDIRRRVRYTLKDGKTLRNVSKTKISDIKREMEEEEII